MSLLFDKNFERYFLAYFNVKTKVHIFVKICIRIPMMVMKDMESSSRAKRKVCRVHRVLSHRVCDNRKIGVVNFTCLKREDGLPWTIKFGLTSWPNPGLPAWPRPYSTKGKKENFVLLSRANVAKTVALIYWQVTCVRTSPAEIARLGLPNAYDRSSDGSNLPNVEKQQN